MTLMSFVVYCGRTRLSHSPGICLDPTLPRHTFSAYLSPSIATLLKIQHEACLSETSTLGRYLLMQVLPCFCKVCALLDQFHPGIPAHPVHQLRRGLPMGSLLASNVGVALSRIGAMMKPSHRDNRRALCSCKPLEADYAPAISILDLVLTVFTR